MKNVLYICLVLLALLAWRDWNSRDIEYAPGVLVPERPIQKVTKDASPVMLNGFSLNRRAEFSLRARVLSSEKYWFGDESELSPVDLALGWGVMSDQQVLDRINITQATRWYFTRYDLPAPIPDREIINNSSNMHIIPADKRVKEKVTNLRRGNIVLLKGYLVDVDAPSGFMWRTSLRRDDTGNGSCEIFYLTDVYVEDL
jgi:hypothetical protein